MQEVKPENVYKVKWLDKNMAFKVQPYQFIRTRERLSIKDSLALRLAQRSAKIKDSTLLRRFSLFLCSFINIIVTSLFVICYTISRYMESGKNGVDQRQNPSTLTILM